MVIDCVTFPRTVSRNLGESMSLWALLVSLAQVVRYRMQSLSRNVYLIAMWDRVEDDSHASVDQSSLS